VSHSRERGPLEAWRAQLSAFLSPLSLCVVNPALGPVPFAAQSVDTWHAAACVREQKGSVLATAHKVPTLTRRCSGNQQQVRWSRQKHVQWQPLPPNWPSTCTTASTGTRPENVAEVESTTTPWFAFRAHTTTMQSRTCCRRISCSRCTRSSGDSPCSRCACSAVPSVGLRLHNAGTI